MNHAITVDWVANNHGYPYRATCPCGWQSNTYAAKHAAQTMGEAHLEPNTPHTVLDPKAPNGIVYMSVRKPR